MLRYLVVACMFLSTVTCHCDGGCGAVVPELQLRHVLLSRRRLTM